MTATRTRKTAAAKADAPQEQDTAAESATETPDSTPQAPDVAPLEPPQIEEAPEPPAGVQYATPTEVIPDDENLAEVILDDATKQPPADLETVFQPLTEYGSTLQCTVRLVEQTFLGPHSNPVERLLQPKGAVVSEGIAARILDRLREQASRSAAS
ncbi:hypothetical protein [Streptomyces subrutilus]|uniref:Uncharacterized protein n=1 Tax=Streptomyces subrutilus TaxID=36818 RepID=A0A1E5NXW5_9ACTN|nr:hypothetical protein [Streptomyces subrutilus]OEJ21109.1 hypothetical protein BGK67_35040 [Streptomyces subrutilus]